jgi:Phasin protein
MQTAVDVYTTGFKAINRLAEANLHAWREVTAQQAKLVGFYADCGQQQLTLWGGAAKPADFLAAESDLTREMSQRYIEHSSALFSDTAKAMAEIIGSLAALIPWWTLTPTEGSSGHAEPKASLRSASEKGAESESTQAASKKRSST